MRLFLALACLAVVLAGCGQKEAESVAPDASSLDAVKGQDTKAKPADAGGGGGMPPPSGAPDPTK